MSPPQPAPTFSHMHNTHTCVDLRLLAPCPGGAGLWLFGSAPLPTIVHHGQDSHFDLLPTLNENWGGGGCGGGRVECCCQLVTGRKKEMIGGSLQTGQDSDSRTMNGDSGGM